MLVQHQLEPKCYVTNPKIKILVVHQVLRIIIIRKDRLRIFMIIYAAFFCEIAFWQRFLLLKKFRRRRESNPWCRVQLFRDIWNQLERKWGISGTLGPIRISPKVEKFNFGGVRGCFQTLTTPCGQNHQFIPSVSRSGQLWTQLLNFC